MASTDDKMKQEWVERMARYEASGKTVEEFCTKENVKQWKFYKWRRKLQKKEVQAASIFTPVKISKVKEVKNISESESGITFGIIRLQKHFDEQALSRILKIAGMG